MHLAFIQGIGPLELTIVLVIVLLIFGPKRLPALARSLGGGMREFKDSITSKHDDDDKPASDDAQAQNALGRPEQATVAEERVEGDVVRERR
ncbi:MAG: Twin-arginine translocation protein TatA [uncultured Solirubrobacteraceae bacterium]|uniref:Sec-independent protein translocase protein TatA n=1 Tax=uncultured Solirubrobacteraceae bacterium TaxID=1162706 RepID=A0A6J4TS70_9ACTN|nr:MAG: Twin-arginine translocation protein TatA [uncultured Solirubrobacteraceae bacterium]